MTENYELIDNEEKHQYEFHVEGYVPRIEYIKSLNQRTRNKFNEVYDIADISILVC